MTVHRIQIGLVFDDHDAPGVVEIGVDNLAVSDCNNIRFGRASPDAVPVLSRVEEPRIVFGIFTGIAVLDAKTVSWLLIRKHDWE